MQKLQPKQPSHKSLETDITVVVGSVCVSLYVTQTLKMSEENHTFTLLLNKCS